MDLRCEKLSLSVNGQGIVESVRLIDKDYEFITGAAGYSAVEDCLQNSISGDPDGETPQAATRVENGSIYVTRSFASGLVIEDTFSSDSGAVRWRVHVSTSEKTPRTANLFLVLPVLGQDRHVFVTHNDAPLSPGNFRHVRYVYGGDQFRGELHRAVALPVVTFYKREADAGLTCAVPAGLPVPAIWYSMFHESDKVGFVSKFVNMRLSAKHPIEVEMLIHGHGGNWQDGLSWYSDRYHDYFTVKNEDVYRTEGAMICSHVLHSEDEIRRWKAQGFAWQELHANMLSYYGEYMPEGERWETINSKYLAKNLDLRKLAALDPVGVEYNTLTQCAPDPYMSKNRLREYIDTLHKNGVAAFIYFNPVLCDKQIVGRFESDIARNEDGTPCANGYYFGVSMNPDPNGGWGRHLIQQVERMMSEFPNCDGIFYDEVHYRHYDFAHDDGITMVHNKPCSMIGFAMADLAERICGIVHAAGKVVWANGPTSLEVVRYLDGCMAEHSSTWMGTVQYFCLEKPMVLLAGGDPVDKLWDGFKKSLVCGGQPDVLWKLDEQAISGDNKENLSPKPADDPARQALCTAFRPLLDMIKGRKWVLQPNVLELPEGVVGNFFELRDGSIAIPLAVDQPQSNVTVKVKNTLLPEYAKAEVITTEGAIASTLRIGSGDMYASIDIPLLQHAAVIRLNS